MFVFITAALILLHAPDGKEIVINRDQVTSLRAGDSNKNDLFAASSRCLVNFADGRFVAVVEECHEIMLLMEDRK